MFEKHFHLQRRPFLSVPTPDRYFAASAIENARESLMRLVQRDEGPGLVIGAAGTGKTMLCRLLEEAFHQQCRVVRLPHARLRERRALLQAILYELGQDYRGMDEGELRLALMDHVTDQQACPGGILILVDEAESLALALLDELRTMTNLTSAGQACVRLVLFGSRRLEERLADPRMESFSQRIAGRYYLENFSSGESRQYIEQQMRDSGGDDLLILTSDAIDTVFRATQGVPRLINQLCDHALILAAINGIGQIDGDMVEQAWTDLQQIPVPRVRYQDPTSSDTTPDIVEFGQLDGDSDAAVEAEVQESTIENIEQHLWALEDRSHPEVELILHDSENANPFVEAFAEEEVVFDRYITPDHLSRRREQQVACEDSRTIATKLDDVLQQVRQTSQAIVSADGDEASAAGGVEDDLPHVVTFSPATEPADLHTYSETNQQEFTPIAAPEEKPTAESVMYADAPVDPPPIGLTGHPETTATVNDTQDDAALVNDGLPDHNQEHSSGASEAVASEAEASEAVASEAEASEAVASEAEASEAEASEAEASEAVASEAVASEAEASEAEASAQPAATERKVYRNLFSRLQQSRN